MPATKAYARGSEHGLDKISMAEVRVHVLLHDKFWPGRYIHVIRVNWSRKTAAHRRFDLFPLAPATAWVAALLRRSGHRSAPTYLSALKREHVTAGGKWKDELSRELQDCVRAATRGLGPPFGRSPSIS